MVAPERMGLKGLGCAAPASSMRRKELSQDEGGGVFHAHAAELGGCEAAGGVLVESLREAVDGVGLVGLAEVGGDDGGLEADGADGFGEGVPVAGEVAAEEAALEVDARARERKLGVEGEVDEEDFRVRDDDALMADGLRRSDDLVDLGGREVAGSEDGVGFAGEADDFLDFGFEGAAAGERADACSGEAAASAFVFRAERGQPDLAGAHAQGGLGGGDVEPADPFVEREAAPGLEPWEGLADGGRGQDRGRVVILEQQPFHAGGVGFAGELQRAGLALADVGPGVQVDVDCAD